MSKKAKQLVAGTLGLLLVGGTFAWFTSSDSITNKFAAGGNGTGGDNAGIVVEEKFNGNVNFTTDNAELKDPMTPGQKVQKEVRVNSDVNYTQFVKANLELKFYNGETEITNDSDIQKLAKNVVVNYVNTVDNSENVLANKGKWIKMGNNIGDKVDENIVTTSGTYYYDTILEADKVANDTDITSLIIDSVELTSKAGNEFKDITFKVVINAESIQATNGAIKSDEAWKDAPEAIKALDKSTSTPASPTN